MTAYAYVPLAPDGASIRLLRLLPSLNRADNIECEVCRSSLRDPHRQPYEALSYTWGDASQTVNIGLSGHVFAATLNLEAALRALRSPDEPRNLWVDSVCINQSDLQEQGQQVAIMWDIYKAAECVVVWLGPEEGDSAIAMSDFARKETQRRLTTRGKPMVKPANYDRSNWCSCRAGDFGTIPPRIGVQKLLGRRWFTRVWVLQEVAAARRIVVACGDQVVDGEDFYREVWGVTSSHASLQKTVRRVRPAIELMSYSSTKLQKESLPLLELIETFRSWGATKPLDKVYALLAFSSDAHDASELRPNYILSPYELACKVVQFSLPDCRILPQTNPKSNAVTFELHGFVLGKITSKWSGKNNMRSWMFDSKDLLRDDSLKDLKVNPLMFQTFSNKWQINILHERKLGYDLVCLLQGASRPTILRFKDGLFSVVMMASPEPSPYGNSVSLDQGSYGVAVTDLKAFTDKPAAAVGRTHTWDEVLRLASAETEGMMKFILTWDPFRQLSSDEVSRYLPKLNDWQIQGAARVESLRETQEQARESGTQTEGSHDCKTMTMLKMMYSEQKEEIEAGTSEYFISLHKAAFQGLVGTTKLLLDANAEVDDRNERGATPLHYAATEGHQKIVQALLDAKATVDAKAGNERTPLVLAAREGHAEVCELLLAAGANPNIPDYNSPSLLFGTTVNGYVDTTKVLLKSGANPNVENDIGPFKNVTPVHLAAELGYIDTVKALIDAGSKVDARTSTATTPLHQAAMNGHTEVVRLLLGAGAEINAQDDNGTTPLDFAIYRQHDDTVDEIWRAGGSKVNTLSSDEDKVDDHEVLNVDRPQ